MFNPKPYFAIFFATTLVGLCSSWGGEAPKSEEQAKTQLFLKGVKLWPNYCGNCHNAPGPANRSPADWDIVMMHMRARANLTPDVADAILEYLKRR